MAGCDVTFQEKTFIFSHSTAGAGGEGGGEARICQPPFQIGLILVFL